jgi:hypothetical protein
MMGESIQSKHTVYESFSTEEVNQLENEDKLIRVLQPHVVQRINDCLETSRHKIDPFIVEHGGAVYFSLLTISSPTQRQQAFRKIQQWQTGVDVDLSSLPRPLHQLLQPHKAMSQRLLRVLILGGTAGIIAGILAMAVSMLIVFAVELILGESFDVFGDMQITAVSFVIFSVLGWMVTTPIIWNRLNQ